MAQADPVVARTDPAELEGALRKLPEVLGTVVFTNPDGNVAEVQAFTRAGADSERVESRIQDHARRRGLIDLAGRVFVSELGAESHLGDRESLQRAAELAEQEARARGPRGVLHPLGALHSLAETGPDAPLAPARVPLSRVLLSTSSERTHAEVILGSGETEARGMAAGDRSPHGARVVAEATLRALADLLPGRAFSLVAACPQQVHGHDAVAVVVRDEQERELLGTVLVRDGHVSEAVVRATLDAVNRRMLVG